MERVKDIDFHKKNNEEFEMPVEKVKKTPRSR
jgi:hypothetical protein